MSDAVISSQGTFKQIISHISAHCQSFPQDNPLNSFTLQKTAAVGFVSVHIVPLPELQFSAKTLAKRCARCIADLVSSARSQYRRVPADPVATPKQVKVAEQICRRSTDVEEMVKAALKAG